MRTDFPTTELYFTLAFTRCKLSVYTDQEAFARKILEQQSVEFLDPSDNESWHECDTRLLLAMASEALPELISRQLPQPKDVSAGIAAALGLKS